ncbi:unnamed protein product [Spirodela intermedia]|uniref:Uncharacterized protein n=1 Tax=Spirodela intermedia TaxID=51605 RepID=A0A7I8IC03_SPIIN|nr:unnamed protein product [Spirodela intermedia]CAA6654884.1 unnamed protein product [Spirodela intermedia]
MLRMDDFDVILGTDFVTKHEADTFLVTLQEVEGEGQKVGHPQVLSLLNEFQDIMPDKLPTKLPPKRDIEHMIELLSRERPPTRASYKMLPTT